MFKPLNFLLFTATLALLSITSCKEKCYRCLNYCKVCTETRIDTTLTITVCSDILTEQYFIEYIDSLTSPSLGWTCTDAQPTRSEQFCGNSSNNNAKLLLKKEAGWRCMAE